MDVLQRFIDEAQCIVELLRQTDSPDSVEIWEQVVIDLENAKRRLGGRSWFPWELPT